MKARFFGKGSSTLEIVIAFAVATLVLTATIENIYANQMLPLDLERDAHLLSVAQAGMESARVSGNAATSSAWGNTGTQISYTPDESDENIEAIVAEAQWQGDRSLLTTLESLRIGNPVVHGTMCNPRLTVGNWRHVMSAVFDTAADLVSQATGKTTDGLGVSDMFVYKDMLYVAAGYTAGDPYNVYLFSLGTDTTAIPQFVSRLQTTGSSANAIAVAPYGSATYAYVLNAKSFNFTNCTVQTNCPHVQVVDVTDPAHPSVVLGASVKMPITGSSGQGIGNTMRYDRGYLYVGLQKPASGPQFGIVDVGGGAATPRNPRLVGTYDDGGYTITGIAIHSQYAYLSTTDNTSGNKQLVVLDISDKAHPHLTPDPVGGYFTAPGSGYGYAVAVAGNRAYLGRSYAGSRPNFYILDASGPATYPNQLPILGSKIVGTTDSVIDMAIRGNLAFLLTNKQFQVWDVSIPGALGPFTQGGSTSGFISLAETVSKRTNATYSGSTVMSCGTNAFYVALRTDASNKDVLSVFYPES